MPQQLRWDRTSLVAANESRSAARLPGSAARRKATGFRLDPVGGAEPSASPMRFQTDQRGEALCLELFLFARPLTAGGRDQSVRSPSPSQLARDRAIARGGLWCCPHTLERGRRRAGPTGGGTRLGPTIVARQLIAECQPPRARSRPASGVTQRRLPRRGTGSPSSQYSMATAGGTGAGIGGWGSSKCATTT